MQGTTTISGYLGATPTVEHTPTGKRVAKLRVAVTDHRLPGEENRPTRWYTVRQWDDAADRAAAHLVRGQHVTVEGIIDAEIYTDRDGHPQIDWQIRRPIIDYGPRPLDAVPAERFANEADRRHAEDWGTPATA